MEDNDKLKLSSYQWGVLKDNVKSLLGDKTITDLPWLTKTKNKSSTISEMSWLINIITQRLR